MSDDDLTPQAQVHAEIAPSPRPIQAFLKRLNEYKELIAIMAFFVGGFLWVFGYFVTKSQFAELKCFSKYSIIANRETLKIRDAEQAILDSSKRLEELDDKAKSTKAKLTEKEKSERKRLDFDLKKLEDAKKVNQENFRKAQAKLDDSECMGGEEK